MLLHRRNAQKSGNATAEYLLASRQMTLTPTTLSLACSFISAITLLGTPSEMYETISIFRTFNIKLRIILGKIIELHDLFHLYIFRYMHGTQYWVIGLSYPFVLAATAHLYLPVYHKFKFNGSAHE